MVMNMGKENGYKTDETFNLRPAKCCENCFHSSDDDDDPNVVWCEHCKGPKGMIAKTNVCDLYKEKS